MEPLSDGKKRNYLVKRVVALFLLTFLLFSIINGAVTYSSTYQRVNAITGPFYKSFQNSTASQTSCKKLPIMGIAANGNDGHLPANVLDNNLKTVKIGYRILYSG